MLLFLLLFGLGLISVGACGFPEHERPGRYVLSFVVGFVCVLAVITIGLKGGLL